MKINKNNKRFTLEMKRFKLLDLVDIEAECPNCGEQIDFSRDNLSYPRINQEEMISIYCCECDTSWEEIIRIEMRMLKL